MVDRIGQQLGNYRLLRLLGKGGFAEVYLGEHLRLGTQAAVKVLYTRLASPDEVAGFEKEAQTIAHLKHHHIVRVLDFDVHDDTPFLVMDYAANGTLRQRRPKGSVLPLPTVISYVKQAAEALQYAHDKKLIHRDIKPENMLLGEEEELLLSDFGIALIAQSSRYQGTQDMAGTIAYMAPEQIQGHPRLASDQYALGIVVYEWLSGDRPFHGSYREIAVQHTITPPPPLREKVPTISSDVEQVLMTALAKDPKERFGSVQAFARALEQACQSDVVAFVKSPVLPARAEAQVPGMATPSSSPEVPPSVVKPSTSPPTLPVTPPSPPKQPTAITRPLGTTLYTYQGHSGNINALAWSSDGTCIASASKDKTVQVWDTVTGKNLLTYTGLSKDVFAVAWSPEGQYLAFSSGRKVQVWDTATNTLLLTYEEAVPPVVGLGYEGYSSQPTALAWSPDGKCIASGSKNATVQIWQSTTGERIKIYRGFSDPISDLTWSPDGKYLAISSGRKVQVWDAATHILLLTYGGHTGRLSAVTWSPDGKRLASGGNDRTVQIWQSATGERIKFYRGFSDPISDLTWSPDAKYLAFSSGRGVQLWDTALDALVLTYEEAVPRLVGLGHESYKDQLTAVAWSPDGKYIASGGESETVQVWVAE